MAWESDEYAQALLALAALHVRSRPTRQLQAVLSMPPVPQTPRSCHHRISIMGSMCGEIKHTAPCNTSPLAHSTTANSTYSRQSCRSLLKAGQALYIHTKTASEMLRRELLSIEVDREDVQSVTLDDDLPSNARISGIAIPLDSESQPAEISASYYDAANKFVAFQKETYGKDPFADEYAVENSPANAEHRRRSTSSSTMATSDGGAASSSSRLSGASGNNGVSFQNSKVARRSSI
ncbi:hypothetical protein C8R48DRAFT_677362 [Suillus tomentosus]|nr:hypothetical protein C8R48DRAFT_677362 [Suillus tomentosus]